MSRFATAIRGLLGASCRRGLFILNPSSIAQTFVCAILDGLSFSEDDCTNLLEVMPEVQAAPDNEVSECIYTILGYA